MPSRILYDTRTGEILASQPEPTGSAGMPSFRGLCRTARVPEDEKGYMETADIRGDILTTRAKRQYKIEDGRAVKKPSDEIKRDSDEESPGKSPFGELEEQVAALADKVEELTAAIEEEQDGEEAERE